MLLSVLTFVGYFLGLVRERILSQTFGIGDELDAFKAAFLIPELLFSVIVASGLAAPFIPIFTALKRDDGEPAAHDFGRTILTLAVLVMGVVSVVLFIIAPLTVEVAASGFDAETRELYTELFRIMCFTQVLFAGSMALGEVLDRRAAVLLLRRGAAALQPRHRHRDGAARRTRSASSRRPSARSSAPTMHLGIRLVGISRTIVPAVAAAAPADARRSASSSGCCCPRPAAARSIRCCSSSSRTWRRRSAVGSVTVIDQARNFQSLPVSLIGVTFALAAFPVLAARYAARDRRGFTGLVGPQRPDHRRS